MQKSELQSRIQRCVSLHHPSILRLAYAYVRNTHDAEDIAQEVFLRYFRAAPVFGSSEHEKAWLLRVTINHCKNLLKSGYRQKQQPMPEIFGGTSPEDSALLDEVLALEEMYRLPIHLHYYEGYSLKEIGEILGELPGTIGTRLARGREQLKQSLGGISHG